MAVLGSEWRPRHNLALGVIKMKVRARHVSDSLEQRDAESIMLAELIQSLGLVSDEIVKEQLPARLKPDWIDVKSKTLVEAYAHLGKVKGGQLHKVKGDILKLIFLERKLGGTWRKILCFADEEAAQIVKGKSWLGEAAREFGVEVHVVPLSTQHAQKLRAAQVRQRMVNPK